jgi:hypothetical protein
LANDEIDRSDEVKSGIDDSVREAIRDALVAQEGDWYRPTEPLSLGDIEWRPDLLRENQAAHIALTLELPRPWARRMEAASRSGFGLTVVAPYDTWLSSALLDFADNLALRPVLARLGDPWRLDSYRSIAELVALERIPVAEPEFKAIGNRLLDRALSAATSNEKGWRFEDFLCFFFSQTSDFEVKAHNYQNATEEIDLLLVKRSTGGVWPAGPLSLVSGKNTSEPVGVPALTSLASKMENRNGLCHLGFLASAQTIASTVTTHALRYSRTDLLVVPLDGSAFRRLLESRSDLDGALEDLAIKAAMA